MNYWKEHKQLRIILMLVTFVLGLVLIIRGWMMTGQMAGLGLMLVGVALILATLYLYNARFTDPKNR
ncbi:hypothetical protein AALB19_09520 [Oscillospiraceae bacterium 50-58]